MNGWMDNFLVVKFLWNVVFKKVISCLWQVPKFSLLKCVCSEHFVASICRPSYHLREKSWLNVTFICTVFCLEMKLKKNKNKKLFYISWCVEVKEIFAVVSQLQQLQIKPRKNSEASMGFEPMTSAIPVRCSTDWAMAPRGKQVMCELNLYVLYKENDVNLYMIKIIWVNCG